MSMLQTFTPMQWVAPNCLGLRVISQLLFNCLNNLFILWFLPHPCSSSSCQPSWGWRCCTVCRTTAGRGSRPGCTAWACVPSSSSPPCFISSPGRRVTWGEDWSINKHSGRRFMPEILVGVCVFVLVLFQCFQSGAFSLHRLFYFWKLPTFSVPFLWLPVLIICFVHPFKKNKSGAILSDAKQTDPYGPLLICAWGHLMEFQVLPWVTVLIKAFIHTISLWISWAFWKRHIWTVLCFLVIK